MEEGDTAPQFWVLMACLALWRPTVQELGAGFPLWLPIIYLGLCRLTMKVGGSGFSDWLWELDSPAMDQWVYLPFPGRPWGGSVRKWCASSVVLQDIAIPVLQERVQAMEKVTQLPRPCTKDMAIPERPVMKEWEQLPDLTPQ